MQSSIRVVQDSSEPCVVWYVCLMFYIVLYFNFGNFVIFLLLLTVTCGDQYRVKQHFKSRDLTVVDEAYIHETANSIIFVK